MPGQKILSLLNTCQFEVETTLAVDDTYIWWTTEEAVSLEPFYFKLHCAYTSRSQHDTCNVKGSQWPN